VIPTAGLEEGFRNSAENSTFRYRDSPAADFRNSFLGFSGFSIAGSDRPVSDGTSQWFLLDKSREETQMANSGDYREISVLGWYPANAPGMTRTAEYINNSKLIGKAIVASPHASGKTWTNMAS